MKRIELNTTRILLILLGIIVAVFISFNTSAKNQKLNLKWSRTAVSTQNHQPLFEQIQTQVTQHIYSLLKQ